MLVMWCTKILRTLASSHITYRPDHCFVLLLSGMLEYWLICKTAKGSMLRMIVGCIPAPPRLRLHSISLSRVATKNFTGAGYIKLGIFCHYDLLGFGATSTTTWYCSIEAMHSQGYQSPTPWLHGHNQALWCWSGCCALPLARKPRQCGA